MNGATCDSKLGSQDFSQVLVHQKLEFVLLDLYSGCGAMSTGLCLGAKIFGLNLVTVSQALSTFYLYLEIDMLIYTDYVTRAITSFY